MVFPKPAIFPRLTLALRAGYSFAVALDVTAAKPEWMGALQPCSPLRAFDKCLWWFGGGDSATAVEVQNLWRIVDELGLDRQ